MWQEKLNKHLFLKEQTLSIVKPVIDCFSLHQLCYFSVDAQGNSICLNSNQDWMEYYLEKHLFEFNPFLRIPNEMMQGTFLASSFQNPHLIEQMELKKKFNMGDSLIITQYQNGCLEGFSFGTKYGIETINSLLGEIPSLRKYCEFFKTEASKVIRQLRENPVNLLPFLNKRFFEPIRMEGVTKIKKTEFLKKIGIKKEILSAKISPRERECLRFYLQGYSAKEIAGLLEISMRTVEYHIENLKIKLCAFSKRELIQKSEELRYLGIL